MAEISLEEIRKRLRLADLTRDGFERSLEQLGGLSREEGWRYNYSVYPYLIGASEQHLADRFSNVFMNISELNTEGKISPSGILGENRLWEAFTHILAEYNSRGGTPSDVISAARKPILKYFENGSPIGMALFKDYRMPKSPILVKYGKSQFLKPMFEKGYLRIANAGMYNNSNLLNSIRDNETSRTFIIPTYKERLKGITHVTIEGVRFNFNESDLEVPIIFDDYFLFSMCSGIHYRMPTDFDGNAAIIIRDPIRFKQILISTFLSRFPDWHALEGPVTYFDPYRDYGTFSQPRMAKHFGYAYQKEARVAFYPPRPVTAPLEPLNLSIGSMKDYADMLVV